MPINLELDVFSLFKQDKIVLDNINEHIHVTDISKLGIGFECKQDLPLNYYFNAKIEINENDFFYSVLKIVRKQKFEDGYDIGCEFVGLADLFGNMINKYGESIK